MSYTSTDFAYDAARVHQSLIGIAQIWVDFYKFNDEMKAIEEQFMNESRFRQAELQVRVDSIVETTEAALLEKEALLKQIIDEQDIQKLIGEASAASSDIDTFLKPYSLEVVRLYDDASAREASKSGVAHPLVGLSEIAFSSQSQIKGWLE